MKRAEFSQHWNQQATSYPSPQLFADQIQVQKQIQVFFFFKWDSLHAKLNSHYQAWSYKRQRIPEFSCVRKETLDIDILVTSRNGDRKIMQPISITSRPPSRKRKWNQLSQFWRTSMKLIPIEKTWAGLISIMSQRFKGSSKWRTNNPAYLFLLLA